MEWYVYITRSKFNHYYTGMSPDPEQRLTAHNAGEGSKFGLDQGPLKLVYISSPFADKFEARKREEQLKGWSVEKKEKLIKGEWK